MVTSAGYALQRMLSSTSAKARSLALLPKVLWQQPLPEAPCAALRAEQSPAAPR